ncbi:MAG: 30S ribosomal protein S5 [Candidatus Brocadia sp.]|uniref:Small ribosomal subunit protein uS5 n=1 Tax=Candidatus Brocadia fulgida TaxID=380242 RepID=A0A0M2UY29_9BACT|nr:MAG: 30S ribosomal protein S5 [Candidatus Brocadia fulgida]MBV6518403.1 30S ribosomal protein S5 [Candidatus Brocadia fulgida]UJS21104.1 MAG: 30S ribosomal protein S5 [Candidatus Brocadia sp.]
MARLDDPMNLEETVVQVNRCTTVTKGGKSMSFSALVVVGDKKGSVGIGFGKAREVPNAVSKAVKEAKKQMVKIPLKGDTIPHMSWGRFKAANIFLKPASPGTGLKAGASARAVLELAGIKNILSKCFGKRNPLNVAKATLMGLKALRTKEEIGALRGVKIE